MATVVVVIGSAIVAFGIGWYATYTRGRVVNEGLLSEAIRGEPAEPFRVVVPVANPATQHDLLRLAAASAHANEDRGTPELVAVNVTSASHPSPLQNLEADRAEHQRELLENAHDIAAEMGVTLRTRAVVAPDVGGAILDVIEEEGADEVILGWDGTLGHGDHVFGATVGPVVRHARCDVSIVKLGDGAVGTPVALIAPGPNAPIVAHQAVEFATVDGTVPTLLNVQPSRNGGDSDAETRGRSAVVDAAEAAGLDPGEYDVRVVVDDDVGAGVVEAIGRYDTVCLGLSEGAEGPGAPPGTVTERVVRDASGHVALIRGS
jgi:nucleotide-binding universal stress UspA family protein